MEFLVKVPTARRRDARAFLKVSEEPTVLGVSTTATKNGKEVPRLHSALVFPILPRLFVEPDDGELDHHSTLTGRTLHDFQTAFTRVAV